MLTFAGLSALERSLRTTRVLSAYLATPPSDTAGRNVWRVSLRAAIRAAEDEAAKAGRRDRWEFSSARDALERAAAELRHSTSDGVALFVTADGVQHVEPLPFPVEPTVIWDVGVAVAPMVRALKEERPVILALLDGKHAVLFSYRFEHLVQLEAVLVDPRSDGPTSGPARSSARFHQAVRGTSGQDAAQAAWASAADRLARLVVQRLVHHAGDEGWVLCGGRRNVVHRVMELLPPSLRRRADRAPSVNVRSARPELVRAARAGASRLRNAFDAAVLERLANRAGAAAKAAVGEPAARRALEEARVRQLFITSRYVRDHAAAAESAVRSALHQGAAIETVSGEASKRLDAMGGIAARLRYAMMPMGATAAGHSVA